MAINYFQELPPDHIAPVYDFYTREVLGPADIVSLKRQARAAAEAGAISLVFSDVCPDENIVLFEEARLAREIKTLTAHRPQAVTCHTNSAAHSTSPPFKTQVIRLHHLPKGE